MSFLGERLRQAREARGVSPIQVEIDTRIRANVIQALEQGDFESLPPEPFLRGLIRSYATYLGADPEEMLKLYVADFTPARTPPPALRPGFLKKPSTFAASAPPEKPPAPTPIPTPPPEKRVPPAPIPTPPPKKRVISAPIPAPPSKNATMSHPVSILPPPPPETLAPAAVLFPSSDDMPEYLIEGAVPANATIAPATVVPRATPTFRDSLAHLSRPPVPLPALILLGLAIIVGCLALALFAFSRIVPVITSLASAPPTATLTRIAATRTPTATPGAIPTQVPMLVATAPPFTTFPGTPSPTLRVTPQRTLETFAGLNLDIEVTEPITAQVGVDGAWTFTGPIAPGTARAWSAQNSLYLRVENPKGALILFNGKPVLPRTYAERNLIERQWILNARGTPVSTAPVPPAAATPPAAPTSPSVPARSPTPTLTPFS